MRSTECQSSYYAPAPRVGALSDDCASDICLSDVCLSPISGPKSRTERTRKTETGTEVAYVIRDPDTTFKVKRSKVNLQGRRHIVAVCRTACCSPLPSLTFLYSSESSGFKPRNSIRLRSRSSLAGLSTLSPCGLLAEGGERR